MSIESVMLITFNNLTTCIDKILNELACKSLLDENLQNSSCDFSKGFNDFVFSFQTFDKVRHSYFGEELIACYKNDIINFHDIYFDLKTA